MSPGLPWFVYSGAETQDGGTANSGLGWIVAKLAQSSRCQRSLRARDMPSPRSVCCLEWPRTVRSCVLAACPALCESRLTSTPAAVPPLTTWVAPRPAPRLLLDTRPWAHLVTSATEYPGGHLNSHLLVSGLGAGGADSHLCGGSRFSQMAPWPQSGHGGTWRGVVCGATAGQADAPEWHPQSHLAGIKSPYWVRQVLLLLLVCVAGSCKASAKQCVNSNRAS